MVVRTLVMVAALSMSAGAPPAAPRAFPLPWIPPSDGRTNQAGTVAGSMTVSGRVSTLAFVHAFPRKTSGRPAVLLVFSDVHLSSADATDDARLSALGNSGKLHAMGILVGADPQGKRTVISNEIYDQGFHGRMSIGGEDTFEARTSDESSAAGRLVLKPAKKFGNGVTFTYDLTFETPIER